MRNSTCTEIKVTVSQADNLITVFNNGSGIPVLMKKELGIYVSEMLIDMLRSGSNFDDSETRVTDGSNGVGASLAVLFCSEFTVETMDSSRSYKQTEEQHEQEV